MILRSDRLHASDARGRNLVSCKEAVRALYEDQDPELALGWVDKLSADLTEPSYPPEVCQLGRTLKTWRTQIAAWHEARITNGRTETMNGLAKRVKRIAFGMTNFAHWRIRVLLYTGRPDWFKLATVTPCPPPDPKSRQTSATGPTDPAMPRPTSPATTDGHQPS